jgi:alpha-L-fucosidase
VILREDIALGERVRAYVLEGKVGGDWIALANGTAIGHKRIQPLEARVVDAVRLRIAEAAASPQVRTLAVFDTGTQPPADWNAVSELWAPNLVGHWRDGRFSLELGKSIPAAAQYTLRFVPASGEVQGFRHVSLLIGGVASPEFIHPSRTRKDQLLLDITAPNHSVLASGEVLGAERGEITLDSAR